MAAASGTDLPGRPAPRSHGLALCDRWSDQRRELLALRRAGAGSDAQAWRYRHIDNLGNHKSKTVRRAIRAAGANLFFLPPYSQDLNPIEQVFVKL
ncbi:hypothetical protein FDV58_39345 [Bradyrhizobium elkanii]|uniref:Tc1-like transposase DDE domain-containing protein n=1 Tax=Bradyrhizobium elkanii TaxID=29448 RepID=A0A4U6RCB7_BRAEL|nr:hypothetical protein FDV58_39345 [Bradyrhizobium elkanii]